MLIEPLRGDGHGGANFLREERDLELFHHPAKGFELALRFGGARGLGLEFLQRVLVGGELAEAFLVFGGVQGGALGADEQGLEITRQMEQSVILDAFQKAGGNEAGASAASFTPSATAAFMKRWTSWRTWVCAGLSRPSSCR